MWLPILLGMLLGIGGYSATRDAVSFGDSALYVQCLAYAAAMCALFPLLYALQEWIVVHGGAQNTQPAIAEKAKDFSSSRMTGLRAIARFEHDFRVNSLLRDALRMFVCWSPYIILMYPGILYWDTGDQLAQFFGMPVFGQESGQIWDHHPFLDTYFYGSVIWLGHAISGRYAVGLFMLSMLHAFLACLAASSMLTYFRKRQLARKPLAVVTAVFCFFPVFPIMFSSIVKDTTNVIVFLIWLTMYLCLIDSRLARIAKPGYVVEFRLAVQRGEVYLAVICRWIFDCACTGVETVDAFSADGDVHTCRVAIGGDRGCSDACHRQRHGHGSQQSHQDLCYSFHGTLLLGCLLHVVNMKQTT